MYHAPVSLDVDEQELEPVEIAPEPVGAETGSDRLREAHLLSGQIEARALFAPYFAVTGVGQTKAALDVAGGLPAAMKRYHLARGVGHYGIFNGSKWRSRIAPVVEKWIAGHQG